MDEQNIYPCETCIYYPQSSGDGKPCCICDTDNPLLNCYQRRTDEDSFRHDNWVDTRSMTAVDKAVKVWNRRADNSNS
jgi:hypothetical protein